MDIVYLLYGAAFVFMGVFAAISVVGIIKLFNWKAQKKLEGTIEALLDREAKIKTMEITLQSSIAYVTEALLTPDYDKYDISRIVHKESLRLTESQHGYISLKDAITGDNIAYGFTNMLPESCNATKGNKTVIFPKGPNGYNALWGHSLNTGEGFYTNSPQGNESFRECAPQGHVEIKNLLSVPIRIGTEVIGQIALANSARDYTEMDLSTINRLASVYATAIDRKQMEDTIKAERDKLNEIMDAIEDGIYIINSDCDIEFANKVILMLFGEVNGRKCYEYLHDEAAQCPWCVMNKVLSGERITLEWYCPKNHKTYSHFNTPIRNTDGSISKFTIIHDISDIKSAREIMKRELDFQRAVAEVSEALLLPDKDIVDISLIINRQAMILTDSLHGYASEIDRETGDNVGHALTDMMPEGICTVDTRHQRLVFPKGKDGYNALWGHALNTRQAFYTNNPHGHTAYRGCIPQGHIPLTNYLAVPAMIGDKLIGQIALANSRRDYIDADLDVIKRLASIYALAVERKRMEEQLRDMNANLAFLVQEEIAKRQTQEQMLIQQSKMAAMGEMIGMIAHQWKQSLNAVALIAQGLVIDHELGGLDDKKIQQVFASTMGQVRFMVKTMDDFRDFLKPAKTKVSFDVKTAIDELISMFNHVFSKHAVNINLMAEHVPNPMTEGYPNEFKQVILNILNNAKDAIVSRRNTDTNLQGQIEIEMTNSLMQKDAPTDNKGQIVIVIRDNGGGIPDDILERIFESYFTTKGADGTGIGLYMSKTIIETNMDGSLTVRNIDDGAEFTITLPII
ncbi:MAG: GAF domain-containing protein [Nitrospirae bacterium]|nr:GAF domain-containing protein [Nitrospirota bacterium]